MYSYRFDYCLGQRVKIIGLEDLEGIVETMSVTYHGLQYRVAYWHGGCRHSEWLRGDEITL